MANTYTQIHLQVVFTVQNRASLIMETWKEELYRYITGIIQNYGHKVLAINGVPDHVHILIGMRPTQSLSELMQAIKGGSSIWINQKGLVKGRFSWQEGYGAFSYSKSHVDSIINYIRNQKDHHQRKTFIKEYSDFLIKFAIEYDTRYIFKAVDTEEQNS
jgi:REP element-mobilizing transposase RayT